MGFLRIATLLIALAAMLTALAALGGAVSPWLDLITHLIFSVFLIALVALSLALWLEKGRLGAAAWMSMAALAACFVLMGPEFAAKARSTASLKGDETSLRVMQFNLWRKNVDPERASLAIRNSGADVVIAVEAFDKARRIPRSVRKVYPYGVRCPCAIAVLSRWPIVDDSVRRDLGRPMQSGFSLVWATIRTPQGDVTVMGTHYTWPTDPSRQQLQTQALQAAAEPFDKHSLIIAGDFNSTPWSFFLRRQDKALGLERRTRAIASWPAGHVSLLNLPALFPVLPIDHVYAGDDWRTVSVKRGPRAGSDHYPVIVTLARKAP